jgi:hypothetical protein
MARFSERPLADRLLQRIPELEIHLVGALPTPP